jgi:hypothetical protein
VIYAPATKQVISNAWNFAHVLRDDGFSFHPIDRADNLPALPRRLRPRPDAVDRRLCRGYFDDHRGLRLDSQVDRRDLFANPARIASVDQAYPHHPGRLAPASRSANSELTIHDFSLICCFTNWSTLARPTVLLIQQPRLGHPSDVGRSSEAQEDGSDKSTLALPFGRDPAGGDGNVRVHRCGTEAVTGASNDAFAHGTPNLL